MDIARNVWKNYVIDTNYSWSSINKNLMNMRGFNLINSTQNKNIIK
jgi:uncharacterized protein YjdB